MTIDSMTQTQLEAMADLSRAIYGALGQMPPIMWTPGDVPALPLPRRGEEIVSDGQGTYDVWKGGHLTMTNSLTLEQAVELVLKQVAERPAA